MRAAHFAALLPTGVPGICFTGNGRIWFRRTTAGAEASVSVAVARAIALSAVYALASGITCEHPPAAAFAAEQKIALHLGDWQVSKENCVEFRGRLKIVLAPADAVRAERFDEARRAARLEEVVTCDRLDFLRDVALRDASTAQLWWLHRNLEGDRPETSWEVFDEVVRPLITNAAPQDDTVARFAKLVVTLVDRVHDEPDRLHILAGFARALLQSMGWQDLADEAAELISEQRSPHYGDSTSP